LRIILKNVNFGTLMTSVKIEHFPNPRQAVELLIQQVMQLSVGYSMAGEVLPESKETNDHEVPHNFKTPRLRLKGSEGEVQISCYLPRSEVYSPSITVRGANKEDLLYISPKMFDKSNAAYDPHAVQAWIDVQETVETYEVSAKSLSRTQAAKLGFSEQFIQTLPES
jgi:hypothetical protein